MKTIYEKNGIIDIPYPQTRFIIRSVRNTNDWWMMYVIDPSNNKERTIGNTPKPVLKLLSALSLDTNIEFSQ